MTPLLVSSERVFVCGVTGSGKTELLARRFLPRARRLLVVDQTGEWLQREPGCPYTYGLQQTITQMRDLAGKDRWRIICSLDPEELCDLATTMLVPTPNPREGFAAKVGGMGVLLDEVDVVTPNSRSPIALNHLWRRGRHAGLSVYAATQRPANVSKEVTSQCRWIVIMRQHEVNDIKYLGDLIGKALIRRVMARVNRVRYSAFLFDAEKRCGYFLGPNGAIMGSETLASPDQMTL